MTIPQTADGVSGCLGFGHNGFIDSQSVFERLPWTAAPWLKCPLFPHLSIVFSGDLLNSEELHLSLQGGAICRHDEATLVLAAYDRWGEHCPERIQGECCFAIRDERAMCLFAARDRMGLCPFFYSASRSRFLFAASPERVASFPEFERKPNLRKLAAHSLGVFSNLYPDETLFEGVLSLPGGASLTWNGSGLRKRVYWAPEDAAASEAFKREADFSEALKGIVFEAIRCRVARLKHPAVQLSGGLDSSAITAVAAKLLHAEGRELHAVAGVLPGDSPSHLTDERSYMDEFRSWPNVRISYASPAPSDGPFTVLEDASAFRNSPLRSPFNYLCESIERMSRECGASAMLDGLGGELGLTSGGTRAYLTFAVDFRWPRLWRELHSLRSHTGANPARALAAEVLRAFSPTRGMTAPVLLSPRCEPVPVTFPRGLRSPFVRRAHLAAVRMWLDKHSDRPAFLGTGTMRCYSPLLDPRIIELCLRAPDSIRVGNGYQRNLVRRALDGVLPPRIQWRTDKVPFSPDYFLRYNRQLPLATDFVATIGASDPIREIVDVEMLKSLLKPVDLVRPNRMAATKVPRTLYLICFLRQFSEFRPH